jgi:cobalt-zinc-cadmium efflux system protein
MSAEYEHHQDGHGSAGSGGHSHGLPAAGHRKPLAIVLCISGVILIVEVIGAIVSGSLALLADAGHMLTDVAGLSLALIAAVLAGRPATNAKTWGYRRAEVLAAAAQAAVLLAVGGFVLIEGIRRLFEPPNVASGAMVVFGVIGLLGNTVSILLLSRISSGNLNTRAALLEVINDALGSLAVLVAAVVIMLTGWHRADAVASLLIGVLILPRTWKLLRETVDVLMEATPRGVDLAHVRAHILEVPHVQAVHDLHASVVASDLPVLTAHVVVDDGCFHDGHLPRLLDHLQQCLTGHFDVEHSTFQFEPATHAAHEHAVHA